MVRFSCAFQPWPSSAPARLPVQPGATSRSDLGHVPCRSSSTSAESTTARDAGGQRPPTCAEAEPVSVFLRSITDRSLWQHKAAVPVQRRADLGHDNRPRSARSWPRRSPAPADPGPAHDPLATLARHGRPRRRDLSAGWSSHESTARPSARHRQQPHETSDAVTRAPRRCAQPTPPNSYCCSHATDNYRPLRPQQLTALPGEQRPIAVRRADASHRCRPGPAAPRGPTSQIARLLTATRVHRRSGGTPLSTWSANPRHAAARNLTVGVTGRMPPSTDDRRRGPAVGGPRGLRRSGRGAQAHQRRSLIEAQAQRGGAPASRRAIAWSTPEAADAGA